MFVNHYVCNMVLQCREHCKLQVAAGLRLVFGLITKCNVFPRTSALDFSQESDDRSYGQNDIYEMNHTLNCGYEIKFSFNPSRYERPFSNCVVKPDKYRTSTGF